MVKRVISIITIMTVILTLGSTSAFAISSKPSSLTVIMECGDEPLEGIDVEICHVAGVTEKNGGIVYYATTEFSGAGADFEDLTKEKNIALAASLSAYASANNKNRLAGATNSKGAVTFTGLSAGLYLVMQANAEISEYIIAPYLVALPIMNEASTGWEYNVTAYPKSEPVKRDNETVSVSVFKVWEGTTNALTSISVQLYRNGIPYGGLVTLDADNYWNHSWTNLNASDKWTVDEINVPVGFVKSVSGSSVTGFIITNTKDNSSLGGSDDANSPKMGDDINIRLWITLSAFGITGLLAMFFVNIPISKRRKKC